MKFAKRMEYVRPSDIRAVGKKIAARPGTISFAGGLPAPELFPLEEIERVTSRVIRERGMEALQYGLTQGSLIIREKICELMKGLGIGAKVENIQITSGSQQGIAFCSMVFLNPDDVIITENPSYLGALNAFRPYQCKFAGVDMDDDGMIMEHLEEILKNTSRAKMIYVIPNFQNPTGRTWSLERRKKFIEIINKYDIPVIEDNPYGELRFNGEHLPSLKSLDRKDRIIYLGSFSKVLCPGLRVGWICADEEIINKFELLKQGADLQSNQLAQYQVVEFLNTYDFKGHIDKIKIAYGNRHDLMIKIIKEEFPDNIGYTNPDGGMFIWVELPENMNSRELLEKALMRGVAFVPGGSFYPNGGHENTLRLNYSNMTEEKINEGMKILARLLKEEIS